MGKQNSKISKMTVFIWRERHVGYRTVEVEEEDTVYSVKQMISEKLGIEPVLLELLYQNEKMDDEKTMAYYNIKESSFIQLAVIKSGEDFKGEHCGGS